MTGQPDPRILLAALASVLNACEEAGMRPKLRHGGIIATRAGWVLPPLDGSRWTTAYPSAAEPEAAPAGRALTPADQEPPPGTVVRDATRERWTHCGEGGYWLRAGQEDGDPESWTKISGNYGPVTVLEPGTAPDDGEDDW